MLRLTNIEKEKYDEFVVNHKKKSHFLQSLSWGELAQAKKNLTPHYLGLIDDDKNIVASALLLEKKLPLHLSYFYCPRGFVIDYNKDELVKEMTKELVKFCKKNKGIFLKIDPDIIYKSCNYLDEENKLDHNPDKIFKTLKEAKFKHLGFTKNFETSQPRYTFRIDMNQSLEDIESHFSKTTKQRISKADKIDTVVEIGDANDVKKFFELMMLTEDRKGFVSYGLDYYEELYKIFNKNKNTKATLFLGKIVFDKTIKALDDRLKDINDQISILPIDNLSKSAKNKLNELKKQKENVTNEIKKYKDYKKEYGDELLLSAHMIVSYGDKSWVLYAGNHNKLSETYVNYKTYYEHIKYCKENGIKIYDQFGTIGDLSEDNPVLGLHEFKKKFGGDYVEFLGEWDYVINPIMYFAFTKLVPMYRKLVKKKSKKELENEVRDIK